MNVCVCCDDIFGIQDEVVSSSEYVLGHGVVNGSGSESRECENKRIP